MSKLTKRMLVIAAAVAALGGIALVCVLNCGRSTPEAAPTDPVARRMQDPEYLAKLDHLREEQRAVMKGLSAAKKAYLEAKAAGADSNELVRLEAELRRQGELFKQYQLRARLVVAAEMNKSGQNQQFQQKGK